MGNSWMKDEYGPEVAELAEQYQAKQISRRTFLKRASMAGVGVVAAATILAACGDDDDSSDTTAAPTTTAGGDDTTTTTLAGGVTVAPTTTTTAAPVEQIQQGGTLREGYNRDVSPHDPLTTNWYDPAFFAIYEAILSNDPSGADVPQFASARRSTPRWWPSSTGRSSRSASSPAWQPRSTHTWRTGTTSSCR